jgi:hypothetical protein
MDSQGCVTFTKSCSSELTFQEGEKVGKEAEETKNENEGEEGVNEILKWLCATKNHNLKDVHPIHVCTRRAVNIMDC